MSTKASTYTLLSEPSEELIVSEPWSIDTYADGLMDELFADIDHILDGRGGLPIPTIEPEFVRLQSIKMPPTVPTTEVKSNTATTEAKKQQLRVAKPNSTAPKTVKVHKKPKRWLGKVLGWGAATVGLVASVVFVQSSGLLNRLTSSSFQQSLLPSKPQVQPQLAAQTDVQADLVKYMLGALSVIDRESVKSNYQSARTAYTAALTPNQSASPKSLVMASNQSIGQLPPPMAANNMQPTQSRAATVVERIYIPVYQAPLPMRYAPPSVPGRGVLPQVPSQPPSVAGLPKPPSVRTAFNNVSKNVDKVTKPLNIFAAVRPALKPLTIQSQPITLSQPKPPTIRVATFRATPPKLPTATAPEPKPVVVSAPEAIVAVAPTNPISHTLEGLLELGEKSAALFKINGVTRRIEIGEGIGTSGWMLVEVANGEAVIRRNGEVRSIYAGQNF
jgi:hypothetical protein